MTLSNASGDLCNKTRSDDFNNGKTLIRIMIEMNKEQIGSAAFQPKNWSNKEEIITPTLPNVSAKICKNIPCINGFLWTSS